jgi:molybdate transport system substrate-binding protein
MTRFFQTAISPLIVFVASLAFFGAPPKMVLGATVAAAADLQYALAEVAEQFRRDTGRAVRLTFGSSGNFTHQLVQGAPFELFFSADEQYIFHLVDKGVAENEGALYAIGRVVLFAPHGSPLAVDEQLQDLREALEDGRIRRFSIANPEHAPYGRAAKAVLKHAELWTAIEPRLVFGENAAQAMQFAASGASQGGIVPLSLSMAPQVARLGEFALIPAEWHTAEPLRQRMALMKSAGETARAFYDYLQQPSAREILLRFGFVLPENENP